MSRTFTSNLINSSHFITWNSTHTSFISWYNDFSSMMHFSLINFGPYRRISISTFQKKYRSMQCLHRPHRTSCRYLHGKYQTMKTKCVIVEFGAKIIINQQWWCPGRRDQPFTKPQAVSNNIQTWDNWAIITFNSILTRKCYSSYEIIK